MLLPAFPIMTGCENDVEDVNVTVAVDVTVGIIFGVWWQRAVPACDAVKLLSLVGITPHDFSELKALGIYVLLLGVSGLALAYWVDEDGGNIKKLLRSRGLAMKALKQEPLTRDEPEEWRLVSF